MNSSHALAVEDCIASSFARSFTGLPRTGSLAAAGEARRSGDGWLMCFGEIMARVVHAVASAAAEVMLRAVDVS